MRSVDCAKTAMRPARRASSRAEWVLWLEHEDDRISRMLHELTTKRRRCQEEARSLRIALTVEDRALYDTLRSMVTDVERPANGIAAGATRRSEA